MEKACKRLESGLCFVHLPLSELAYIKDPLEVAKKKDIIYSISCQCGLVYIGETCIQHALQNTVPNGNTKAVHEHFSIYQAYKISVYIISLLYGQIIIIKT